MSSSAVGIIAEDETDYLTLRTIIHRIAGQQTPTRKRIGNGSSKIRVKAPGWLRQLATEGCTSAIILHDLDRNPLNNALNDEVSLRQELTKVCSGVDMSHLICIPVEEIEAWFWSDPGVIEKVGRGAGRASPSPHLISYPKEGLIRLSRDSNSKPRYSTNDNPRLAEILNIELCRSRCPSFRDFFEFVIQSCRKRVRIN